MEASAFMQTKQADVLSRLPKRSRVAVVTMMGTCCPVTLGHIQGFLEARSIILDNDPKVPRPAKMDHFDEVIGLLTINDDRSTEKKLAEKGLAYIREKDRGMLIELATEEYPWLGYSPSPGGVRTQPKLDRMKALWPDVVFTRYEMNGADDVVKHSKWKGSSSSKRGIAMGRPGDTDKVKKGMKADGINSDDGFFILGPELEDISSTAVRKALQDPDERVRDRELKRLLHPKVAEWNLEFGPYGPMLAPGKVRDEGSWGTCACGCVLQ